MVGTIGSVGYGAGENTRRVWRRLFSWYLLGSALGGAVLGIGLGFGGLALDALERLIQAPRLYANGVGIAALIALGLRDLGAIGFPLPSRNRQVPMAWKNLPGMWSPLAFGFALGMGVWTTIYLASFYAIAVVALLLRDLLAALVVAGTYGLGRAVLVYVGAHTARGPDGVIEALAPRARSVARINGALSVVTGMALATASLGPALAISRWT